MTPVRVRKIGLSFAALFLGWVAGSLYYVIYSLLFSSFGRPTDVEAILFWTVAFSLLGWVLFVIPLVLVLPDSSRFQHARAAIVGAGVGVLVFLVLVGWWTGFWNELLYLGYSLIIGATAGLAYSTFGRRMNRQR